MVGQKKQLQHTRAGTTLIEIVVTVGIFSMLGLIFAQTFALAVAHVADARMRNGAVAVATQQMEQLRNLTYDAVAVQGGVPNGTIDPDIYVTLGAREYRVLTDIRYVDDPDDGTIDGVPTDVLPTDYKNVQIDVTWGDASDLHRVRLVSQFVPPGVESAAGGGTMVINVFDAEGVPLENAAVGISNAMTVPPIAVTAFSDASGRVLVPGAPAASEYVITISKDGYETVTTYPAYPTSTFYPNDRHMSVTEGDLVTQSLMSSVLSDVTLHMMDPFGEDVVNEEVQIVGGRALGTTVGGETVYGLDQAFVSDANGEIVLDAREAGTYTVSITGVDYNLFAVDDATTATNDAFALSQGTTPTITVTLMDMTVPSVVVEVKDADTGTMIVDATVRIENSALAYDATAQTNAYGEIFFPLAVDAPLVNGGYTMTVTAPGYEEHAQAITINELTKIPVTLTAS